MRTDLLRVVEAAHRIGGDDVGWLQGIATEARGAVPGGMGSAAWTFQGHDPGQACECVGVDASPVQLDAIRALARTVAGLRRADDRATTGGLRSIAAVAGVRTSPAWRAVDALGARDVVMAWHAADDGAGVGIALLQARRARIADGLARRWELVLRQLVGAHAMRLRVHGPPAAAASGAVEPQADGLRDDRRAAATAADAVEGDGEGAGVAAWAHLIEGRITVVDRFDAHGRRWLVARAAQGPRRTALDAIDATILRLRAGGASMKVIAAELHLSISSVSRRLDRAMNAMNLRTPSELVGLVATAALSEADPE